MGILLTFLLPVMMAVLGVVRPRMAFYVLLGTFIFFDELGPGFTTFRGAFPFNAAAAGLLGTRLIELMTVAAYVPILLLSERRTGPATGTFAFEKLVFLIMAVWIAVLTTVEVFLAGSSKVSHWRLIVTGAMQFHMMVLLFRDFGAVDRLVKTTLVMLCLKASYGLLMFAAGQGTQTPRGTLPFFWDSKQVEAFALGAIALFAYMLNFQSIDPRQRMFRFSVAALMFLVLLMAVGGSIRRTVWVSTVLALLLLMLMSRRTTFIHYFVVVLATASAVAVLMLAPGLDKFREHMGKYVASMNLFDEKERIGNIENDVHFDNVKQYYRMITENADILALGAHGPSGAFGLKDLTASYAEGGYRLGMAHNGVLRSVLLFGVLGGLVYVALFFYVLRRTIKLALGGDPNDWLTYIGLACGVQLCLEFSASFFFVPPFYTSSKGLFYTFLEMFVLGAVYGNMVLSRRVRHEGTQSALPLRVAASS